MLHRVALPRINVSEERSASIIKVEGISELGTVIASLPSLVTLSICGSRGDVMSPVGYELCISLPEDGILHSHRRENLKSYINKIFLDEMTLKYKVTGLRYKSRGCLERFEVFTAVTMKNGVFWVVTLCGSCKNRRFGGTWRLLH
jgi:hypothetical protein